MHVYRKTEFSQACPKYSDLFPANLEKKNPLDFPNSSSHCGSFFLGPNLKVQYSNIHQHSFKHTPTHSSGLSRISSLISKCFSFSFAPVATHPLAACVHLKKAFMCVCVCVCVSEWMASALWCSLPAGYSPPPDSSSLTPLSKLQGAGSSMLSAASAFPLFLSFSLYASSTKIRLYHGSIMLTGPGYTFCVCVCCGCTVRSWNTGVSTQLQRSHTYTLFT